MSKFEVGEIATLVWMVGIMNEKCRPYIGSDVKVIGGMGDRLTVDGVVHGYAVVASDGFCITSVPGNLRKKRPPESDINDVTTWDKCAWRPREYA